MTMLKTRLTACALAVTLTASTMPANAGWMEDFYQSAGSAANVTPAQAISTQSLLGYSGGGVTWRVPNRTFQPFQINPPSIKAGCGGIDAFLGGFSFVNKDAFVQALRNFGQAAVGYFFMLALRSMAPEVAVTLEAINDIAQRVNQFGMGSCQAAKLAVDTFAGQWLEDNRRDASSYARSVGEFVDHFDATLGIATAKDAMQRKYMQNYGKDKSLVTSADIGNNPPVDVNLVYWLMKQSNQDVSDDEINVIMSLVGPAYIIKSFDTGTEGGVINDGKGESLSFLDLVGSPDQDTANIKLWKCANSECTDLTNATESIKSFSRMAYELIDKLRAAIISKTNPLSSLTPLERSVLNLSSLPLARYAALTYTSGIVSGAAGAMQSDIAQLVGLDAASNFIRFYSQLLEKAAAGGGSKLKNIEEGKVERIRERIKALNAEVASLSMNIYALRGKPFEKMEELAKIERSMYSSLNANLAASARFAKRN